MARSFQQGDEPVAGYKLTRFLGRGGFGEVWQAEAPGGTEVAFKIIDLGEKSGLKEFPAIQRVKRVRHPNLVPIIALWLRDENGRLVEEVSSEQQLSDSNYKPAELFIAMGEAYWPPIRPRVSSDASTSDAMRALANATIDVLPERAVAAVGRLSGLAHTLEHPELRQQVQDVTAGYFELGAEWLETLKGSENLPMPADQLVRVLHALIEGLVLQRLLTPDLYPDEVFHAAFRVFGARDR